MSKMSQLHAELEEQCAELGFIDLDEARANGYEVDYETGKLVDGRAIAHREWLREKGVVLDILGDLMADAEEKGEKWKIDGISHAIDFVEEAHD